MELEGRDHVDRSPLNLGHTQLAQELLLFEKLQFGISESLKIRPLRLLANRNMVSCGSKMSESLPNIFDALVKAERDFGFAKDASLFFERRCQVRDDILLCINILDGIGFGLVLDSLFFLDGFV